MEKLLIKEGLQYVTRNGIITEPLSKSNNGTNYRLESKINEPKHAGKPPTVASWLKNGRYLCDIIDHELDLVEEYSKNGNIKPLYK